MNTFQAILKQEYLISKRSISNLLVSIGMPVAFFLLFTNILANENMMPAEIAKDFVRQYMMQMTAFSSLSFTFFSLPFAFQEDRNGNRLRTIQHSPIPIWQYYASKIIGILAHFVLAIIAIFVVGYVVKDIRMPLTDWFMCALILFGGAICFMPFGALIAHIRSTQTLSIVSNIFYLGLALLGGLWMPIQIFPDFLKNLAKLTPTYHLNNLIISYFDKDFSVQSLLILLGYAIISLGIALAVGKKLEVK